MANYRYILVSATDEHVISTKKFSKIRDAREQMRKELMETLIPDVYTEEEFEEYKSMFNEPVELEDMDADDFGFDKNSAWVSSGSCGWVDWEIFDLKTMEVGENS